MKIIQRIDALIAERGLNRTSAAVAAGLSRDAIRNLARNENQKPRGDTLEKLAAFFEVSEQFILTGDTGQTIPRNRPPRVRIADARPVDVEMPQRHEMPRDVPVMGTAAGSYFGAFELEGGPIDYVARPPALARSRDVYALYIVGESMSPVHNPGDLRFVDPARPPRVGDDVIVQTRNRDQGQVEAMIGRLAKRSAEKITLHKLNPDSTVQEKSSTIVSIHRVLTMNELFGV